MQSKKLHGSSCLLNDNYSSSQPLRNIGIRNMTKIGRNYVPHLLEECISLWSYYLSLLDKLITGWMFPSCIWADAGPTCPSREQSSCSPSTCLQKLIPLLLAPFKADLASWKKKKAAPWCFHVVHMQPSGGKTRQTNHLTSTCGVRYQTMGICNCNSPGFVLIPGKTDQPEGLLEIGGRDI